MITVSELAEFIWCAEYDCDIYPWKDETDDSKAYYLDCAKALLATFDIKRKSPGEARLPNPQDGR